MALLTPVLYAALLAPAVADKPEELIVGKWTHTEKAGANEITVTLEFTKDSKLNMEMTLPNAKDPLKITGSYKVVDDKTLEITAKDPKGDEKTDKGGFEVTKDKLTLIDKTGKKTEFTRVTK
jgi:uncharacterized protein (TIGR03066 family)